MTEEKLTERELELAKGAGPGISSQKASERNELADGGGGAEGTSGNSQATAGGAEPK